VFWGFSSEVLSNESNFIYSSFPTFSLSFTRTNNLKHFSFGHWLYFFKRYAPFSGFLLSFLFYHICQYFRIFLLLSVHKISRHCAFLHILNSTFCIFLLMLFDSFFHLNFFFESRFIKEFCFKSSQSLCFFRYNFSFSCLLFSSLLIGVHSLTESFFVKIHIIILRHFAIL